MKVSDGDINETFRQPNSRLLQNNWLTLTQLHQQNHKSERVSRFLTARQHNQAIQCHSRWRIQDSRQIKNTENTQIKQKTNKKPSCH